MGAFAGYLRGCRPQPAGPRGEVGMSRLKVDAEKLSVRHNGAAPDEQVADAAIGT